MADDRNNPFADSVPPFERNLGLAQIIEQKHNILVTYDYPRFKSPEGESWTSQGFIDNIRCPKNSQRETLEIWRKPYESATKKYHYWGIFCNQCLKIFTLGDFDKYDKKQLREWSKEKNPEWYTNNSTGGMAEHDLFTVIQTHLDVGRSLIEYEMGYGTFMKPGWSHIGLVPDTPCDNCGFRGIHLFQNHPQTSPTGKRFGIFCKKCKTLKNWNSISQLVQSKIKDFLGSPVNEFRPDKDTEVIEPNTYLDSEDLNSVVDELTALVEKMDHKLAVFNSLLEQIHLLGETKKPDVIFLQICYVFLYRYNQPNFQQVFCKTLFHVYPKFS